MATLEERLQEDDVRDLPDWQAAEVLNAPDVSSPEVVVLKSRPFGIGTILEAFGPIAGAGFLNSLETLSATDPIIKWSFLLLKEATLDAASPALRGQLDAMAAGGIISSEQAQKIKALAEEKRFPSWAEVNGIEVTARTVGLARGGA
jgi:hypothetical protein